MRLACLETLELEIIGLAETHLIKDNVLNINGYSWYGNNRKSLHRNAKCGSGGAGFLIDNNFGKHYNTEVVDDTFDGILWLKLHNKFDNSKVFVCCCYLPPNHSTRQVDAHEFFIHFCQAFYECNTDIRLDNSNVKRAL